MRSILAPLLFVLTLAACGSAAPEGDAAPDGAPVDVAVDQVLVDGPAVDAPTTQPDDAAPCGGLCGAGTVCQGGRCVAVDAGTSSDAAPVDALADVLQPDVADASSTDAGALDVGDVGDVGAVEASADAATDRPPFTCFAGFADCDGDASNTCEAPLATDARNCGACGTVCAAAPHAAPACASGRCAITCEADFADCDGNPANGCEASLAGLLNCGRCGNFCPATLRDSTCEVVRGAATCVCPSALTQCSSGCVDTRGDSTNCGRCGNRCTGSAARCVRGVCVV